MTSDSRVRAARRAWHWSLFTAIVITGTALFAGTGNVPHRHALAYILVSVVAWCSAAIQRWALSVTLSALRTNDA